MKSSLKNSSRLDLINLSPLSLTKLKAVRVLALAVAQHLLANVYLPHMSLHLLTNGAVHLVRVDSTHSIILHSKREGVPDFEWTSISTRLAHLLNMLNKDDQKVPELLFLISGL